MNSSDMKQKVEEEGKSFSFIAQIMNNVPYIKQGVHEELHTIHF